MERNVEFYERAFHAVVEIAECIAKHSNGKKYHNLGSVEWCPEVGPSFVPAGRTGRYNTISFGADCITPAAVHGAIEQDQLEEQG